MTPTRSSSAVYVANVRRSTRMTLACSSLAPSPSAAATSFRLAGSAKKVSSSSFVRASSAELFPYTRKVGELRVLAVTETG